MHSSKIETFMITPPLPLKNTYSRFFRQALDFHIQDLSLANVIQGPLDKL
jgi:hypothetical protein